MSDKMKKSIRNKLMTMTITVSLIAITLLSIVSAKGFSQMKESSDAISSSLVEVSAETSERIIQTQALEELDNLAIATANTIDSRIQTYMNQVNILSSTLEEMYANPSNYGRIMIYPAEAKNQGVTTSQIAYAEYTNQQEVIDEIGLIGNLTSIMNSTTNMLPGASSTHIGTETGLTIMFDKESDQKVDMGFFDPTVRTWYTSAVEEGKPTWSDLYDDNYGRGLTITCGGPVYGANGDIKAVVAIGCKLSEISSVVTDVSIRNTGIAIVVDNHGNVIMGDDIASHETGIVTDKQNLFNSNNQDLINAAQSMINQESGIVKVDVDGTEIYMAYQPMESIPWTVVTLIELEEILEPVVLGKEQTTNLAISAQEEADKIAQSTFIAMVAGMLASAVLALLVGFLYSDRISSPIRKLEAGVREIAKGGLDFSLDIKTGDEIENLAEAFNIMTNDLKKHISDLTNVTAEKERIGVELGVATQIQSSMLPNTFPAFPEHKEFDIYASMVPAKEVGGDFYDFFLVDETHLGLVIADVSGKGVPAALFMVIAKTLIKNYAQKGESPSLILEHTNNQLCQNNDANMFVTAWIAILDITNGELSYSNAGHNPPLIKQNNGEFKFLNSDPNFVLAGFENMEYEQYKLKLEYGDILYLYTDGVTESTNINDELYSEEKLLAKINKLSTFSLKEILDNIKEDIDNFVGKASQFDDITMLAVKFLKKD